MTARRDMLQSLLAPYTDYPFMVGALSSTWRERCHQLRPRVIRPQPRSSSR